MPDPTTMYGDISPRTAAYAAAQLLKRALPLMVTERWGQAKPLPSNASITLPVVATNDNRFFRLATPQLP